jgi:hypothetical protein
MPAAAEDLVTGETQLKTGIDSAGDAVSSFVYSDTGSKQVSFVSDRNANVRSVQFIFKTDELKAAPSPAEETIQAPEEKGFFKKLFSLFG